MKMQETGPTVYRPYPRKNELEKFRLNFLRSRSFKGQVFSNKKMQVKRNKNRKDKLASTSGVHFYPSVIKSFWY